VIKKYPTTRAGWAAFYEKQFNRTESSGSAHLAMWYALLALAFGDD